MCFSLSAAEIRADLLASIYYYSRAKDRGQSRADGMGEESDQTWNQPSVRTRLRSCSSRTSLNLTPDPSGCMPSSELRFMHHLEELIHRHPLCTRRWGGYRRKGWAVSDGVLSSHFLLQHPSGCRLLLCSSVLSEVRSHTSPIKHTLRAACFLQD
ncbi:hypothetical protein GOODEAATRI_026483 [Goodea atripinnis]|uniref:Uncharacterized protein n=1 Tax=Goodea atripinnis TaxID=208336 RepID=A0ABV0N4J5_9TELE